MSYHLDLMSSRVIITVSRDELLNALDELVPVSIGHDPDLLKVLVVHLGQDVDADLLTVEDLPKLFQAQTEMETFALKSLQ